MKSNDKTFTYVIASPEGDIPVTDEYLEKPFLLAPTTPHPFLLLGDYFDALREAIQSLPGSVFNAITNSRGNPSQINCMKKLIIRSEKHGAFYHIANFEFSLREEQFKTTISTAVSHEGKVCLARDHETLSKLNALGYAYLPAVYHKSQIEIVRDGETESFHIMLSEWFEDYHEWHLDQNGQEMVVWDHIRGVRMLPHSIRDQVFKKMAEILTLFYNTETGEHITSWHHAAGDFIIRDNVDRVDVKLITARDYLSLIPGGLEGMDGRIYSAILFFLNLTIRMRLDRVEGVSQNVWAGDFAVSATVAGFFDVLYKKEKSGICSICSTAEFLLLLQQFTQDEYRSFITQLLGFYMEENAEETSFIHDHISSHLDTLCIVLNEYELA